MKVKLLTAFGAVAAIAITAHQLQDWNVHRGPSSWTDQESGSPENNKTLLRPEVHSALDRGAHDVMSSLYQMCGEENWTIGCHETDFACIVKKKTPLRGLERIPKGWGPAVDRDLRTIYDGDAYRRTHPVMSKRLALKKAGKIPKGCDQGEIIPSCFAYGAGPIVKSGTILSIDGVGRNKKLANGVYRGEDCRAHDCSGFMSQILLAGGQKIWKKTPRSRGDNDYRVTTSDMYRMFRSRNKKNLCLHPPRAKSVDGIPSFIFGVGGEHSFLLQPNPKNSDTFGIKKALNRKGGCRSLTFRDFDFYVVQSSAQLDSIYPSAGPSRSHVHSVAWRRRDPRTPTHPGNPVRRSNSRTFLLYSKYFATLESIATQLCFQAKSGRSLSIENAVHGINRHREERDLPGIFALSPSSDPSCKRTNPPRIDGGECAEICNIRNSRSH